MLYRRRTRARRASAMMEAMRTAPARRLFLLAPLAGLIALLALACGGGGSSDDEAYLRDLCTANNDLESAMLRGLIGDRLAGGDAPDDDPAETLATILAPVGDWIEAVRAATPPDDVAAFHEAALDALDGLLDLFADAGEASAEGEDGDAGMDALFGLFAGFATLTEIPELPQETLDRLDEASAEVSECGDGLIAGQLLDQFLDGFPDGFGIDAGETDGSGADDRG